MDFRRGEIVISRAGHDKGKVSCIMDTDGDFVLLADGKARKTERPKRKRHKHVQHAGQSGHPAVKALCSGQSFTDSALRRALAVFRDEYSSVQGGNTLGKKRYD